MGLNDEDEYDQPSDRPGPDTDPVERRHRELVAALERLAEELAEARDLLQTINRKTPKRRGS